MSFGDNFKGFVTSRPPLVVFVTVLGLFAIILMTLAYYVNVAEVRNPDISEDWNVFLENFAELEFCIMNNYTDLGMTSTTMTPTTTKAAAHTSPPPSPAIEVNSTTTAPWDGVRNYSVAMYLTIIPTKEFISIPHNLTYLTGSIMGAQIGLKGLAGEEFLNVTMTLPVEWNNTQCSKLHCEPVHIYTCVYFQAQQNVFPSSRSPQICESVNDTGIEYHTKVVAQQPAVNMIQPYYCKSKPVITIDYRLDPTLTVYLSLNDRSVINLHLLHTSYFLFVMVVTILLYAVFRGKPLSVRLAKHQQQQTQHLLNHTDA